MRGILSAAGYVPSARLGRAKIGEFFGSPSGRGARSVASYDEDTTTMGVEAGRLALRAAGAGLRPSALWFATADPAYLDKTNATAIHAALRLDADVPALDFGGAVRSGIGALGAALRGSDTTLVVSSDLRSGLPTSADESEGGDGAAAILVGGDRDGELLAELIGAASVTEEFLDRWRTPGEPRSHVWEERFGERHYLDLGARAWDAALKAAALTADGIDRVIVTGPHARAVAGLTRKLRVAADAVVDNLASSIGNTGTAHAGLLLAATLETTAPDQTIAVLSLADGADALIFRTTNAIATFRPDRTVASQIANGDDRLSYSRFLRWRQLLPVEPPRRPEPQRPSAAAIGRSADWKFGFVGSQDRSSGVVHLPPTRTSMVGGTLDEMDPAPMADVPATIATFTVDHVSYSLSPPIIAAILDFDGGGRFPSELTDVAADEVRIGDRVEMTFRRLFTVDGIHNYFWKARPIREGSAW